MNQVAILRLPDGDALRIGSLRSDLPISEMVELYCDISAHHRKKYIDFAERYAAAYGSMHGWPSIAQVN